MDHEYRFQITAKQQFILLARVIIFGLFIIGGTIFFKVSLNSSPFLSVALVLFFIDTLPALVLFIQYWMKNRNARLTINTQTEKLIYQTPTFYSEHAFSDIISFQYYINLGKGTGWYSFGEYRYYKIIFYDNTEIIITCLMINNIESSLESLLRMKAKKHARLLCLIT